MLFFVFYMDTPLAERRFPGADVFAPPESRCPKTRAGPFMLRRRLGVIPCFIYRYRLSTLRAATLHSPCTTCTMSTSSTMVTSITSYS